MCRDRAHQRCSDSRSPSLSPKRLPTDPASRLVIIGPLVLSRFIRIQAPLTNPKELCPLVNRPIVRYQLQKTRTGRTLTAVHRHIAFLATITLRMSAPCSPTAEARGARLVQPSAFDADYSLGPSKLYLPSQLLATSTSEAACWCP